MYLSASHCWLRDRKDLWPVKMSSSCSKQFFLRITESQNSSKSTQVNLENVCATDHACTSQQEAAIRLPTNNMASNSEQALLMEKLCHASCLHHDCDWWRVNVNKSHNACATWRPSEVATI